MRPAGPGHGLWRRFQPLQREQARGRGQVCGRPRQDHHEPLHPLHALRPVHDRGRRRAGARRHRPRRGHGDHDLSRAGHDLRAAGQRGRSLPGRRAHLQALCLRRAAVGVEQDRVDRRHGRGRLRHPHRYPRARGHAHPAARQRRRERGMDFRQDPPCGRRTAHPAPRPALHSRERAVASGLLARRLRRHRRQGQRYGCQAHRRHRRRSRRGRGNLRAQGFDDAAGRRQSRLPAGRCRARPEMGEGVLSLQRRHCRDREGRCAAARRLQSAPGSGHRQRPHPQALAHGGFPHRLHRRAGRPHLSLRLSRRRAGDAERRGGGPARIRRCVEEGRAPAGDRRDGRARAAGRRRDRLACRANLPRCGRHRRLERLFGLAYGGVTGRRARCRLRARQRRPQRGADGGARRARCGIPARRRRDRRRARRFRGLYRHPRRPGRPPRRCHLAGRGLSREIGNPRQHRGTRADGRPRLVPAGRGARGLGDPARAVGRAGAQASV